MRLGWKKRMADSGLNYVRYPDARSQSFLRLRVQRRLLSVISIDTKLLLIQSAGGPKKLHDLHSSKENGSYI